MDVPPLPAFTSLKGHAAEQRDFYYDAAWGMAHMLAIYGALEIIGSFADPADGILWITQQLAGAITVDPGQEAVRVLFNLSAYHQGAANLGLSEAELEAMRADFLAIQYTFNEADFLALIDEIQTVNTALMTDLNTLRPTWLPSL